MSSRFLHDRFGWHIDIAVKTLQPSSEHAAAKAVKITFSTETLLRVRLFDMSAGSVPKDKLFLIKPGFMDPQYPDQRFYCWHCALIEGVISSFPQLENRLDIERIEWERPRKPVIELVGEENQSLPLLILAGDPNTFISDKDQILEALSQRHGFPKPHP